VARRADSLTGGSYAKARALADWKARVLAGWDDVRIESVESDAALAELGASRTVSAVVSLGSAGKLTGDDVQVQLLHGPVGPNDEIPDPVVAPMQLVGLADGPGTYSYSGSFSCELAGRYGFSVRLVPVHPDLSDPVEMGCITWA
jgi:starch phosphorylase